MASEIVELVCLTHPESCNGICDQATARCICPAGGYWVDDTSFFRYQNCAMPYWYNKTVASLFLAISVITQIYIFMFYTHKQGFARSIIQYASLTNISIVIASISHIAYNGTNPIYWLSMAVGIFGAASGFTTYLIAFFSLNFKTAKKNVPEKLIRVLYIVSVTSASLPGFVFGFAGSVAYGLPQLPTFSPAYYNNFVACMAGTIPIQILLTGPLLFQVSNQLIKSIKETVNRAKSLVVNSAPISNTGTQSEQSNKNNENNVESIVKRLTLFKNAMIFIVIPGEIGFCVGVSLLHFLLRFQYNYILFWLLMVTLQLTVITYVIVAGRESSKNVSGPKNPSAVHGSSSNKHPSKNQQIVALSNNISNLHFDSVESEMKKQEDFQSESGDGSYSTSVIPNHLQESHIFPTSITSQPIHNVSSNNPTE